MYRKLSSVDFTGSEQRTQKAREKNKKRERKRERGEEEEG